MLACSLHTGTSIVKMALKRHACICVHAMPSHVCHACTGSGTRQKNTRNLSLGACACRWLLSAYDHASRKLIGIDVSPPWHVKSNNDSPGGVPFVIMYLSLDPSWPGWVGGEPQYTAPAFLGCKKNVCQYVTVVLKFIGLHNTC